MFWRLAIPLLYFLGPAVIPRLMRTASVVWKLSFDGRVNILLRLLVPATLIYFFTPIARIPMIGLASYLIVIGLAVYLLLNLAPREVVESYAPWRIRHHDGPTARSGGKEKVVEGHGRVIDEEEPPV